MSSFSHEIELDTTYACDYQDICTFCHEVDGSASAFIDLGLAKERNEYILWENNSFVAVPCLGPLTDWYVLIVAKRHTLSTGWMNSEEREDLLEAKGQISQRLQKLTGYNVIIFEHGSYDFRDKGGACQDHAHIHMIATQRDGEEFLNIIREHVDMKPVENWMDSAVSAVQMERRSYLSMEANGRAFFADSNGAPSQFFRKSLCSWLGVDSSERDWLAYPNTSRLKNMLHVGLEG